MNAEEHRKKLFAELKQEQMYAKHFIDSGRERGQALSVVIPLIRIEDLIDLFAELWDLRAEKRLRKEEKKKEELK